MNRLESVRHLVDRILHSGSDPEACRSGFVHLYGVSAAATLLAHLRGLDAELAAVAGMLHDVAAYETGEEEDHAARSAERARELLTDLGGFAAEEIGAIVRAIACHSEKGSIDTAFAELLKDADVLQRYLYDPAVPAHPRHRVRRDRLVAGLRLRIRPIDGVAPGSPAPGP